MRVLCEWAPAGPSQVRTGWGRVFAACGHQFGFWNPDTKSAFDAFHEASPDLFLGTTYGVTRAVAKCIAARPRMKVALFGSAWGELVDGIDRKRFPIVLVSDEEKRTIERLKRECGKPDFVFIHAAGPYLDLTMGGWRSIGVEPVSVLNAADIYQYFRGRRKPELACDWGWVGGKWGYKSVNLDKFVLPLCESGLRGKIFSMSPWGVPQHLGYCDDNDARDLFASAAVCPNVSEPHSTAAELGFDTVERPYKVLSAGGFCVSDYVPEAASHIFTNGELVFAKTPGEFVEAVRHFAANPRDRLPYMKRGLETVLSGHTYHHRVATMLERLGFREEAEAALAKKRELAG